MVPCGRALAVCKRWLAKSCFVRRHYKQTYWNVAIDLLGDGCMHYIRMIPFFHLQYLYSTLILCVSILWFCTVLQYHNKYHNIQSLTMIPPSTTLQTISPTPAQFSRCSLSSPERFHMCWSPTALPGLQSGSIRNTRDRTNLRYNQSLNRWSFYHLNDGSSSVDRSCRKCCCEVEKNLTIQDFDDIKANKNQKLKVSNWWQLAKPATSSINLWLAQQDEAVLMIWPWPLIPEDWMLSEIWKCQWDMIRVTWALTEYKL